MNHEHHGGMMGAMEGSGGDMGGMPGGMPVAFDWGIRVTLFFDSWATETAFDYLVALVGVFLLCIAQEHLFYFRTSLRLGEGVPMREDLSAPIVPKPYSVPNVRQRTVRTFLYGVNLASSYLVMLAVMSCNAGVFAAVVSGLSAGHFLFTSRRPVAAGAATSEACHPEY